MAQCVTAQSSSDSWLFGGWLRWWLSCCTAWTPFAAIGPLGVFCWSVYGCWPCRCLQDITVVRFDPGADKSTTSTTGMRSQDHADVRILPSLLGEELRDICGKAPHSANAFSTRLRFRLRTRDLPHSVLQRVLSSRAPRESAASQLSV